ncbi:MAG TPA: hypothetical protein VGI81_28135 [Tepidisphaeraceae bacterium]|jgi:hypothetical protein
MIEPMLCEGKEQALDTILEAKRVRDALSAADGLDAAKMLPVVLRSLGQLIDLTESLLDEREEYESRLHRSRPSPDSGPIHASPPH